MTDKHYSANRVVGLHFANPNYGVLVAVSEAVSLTKFAASLIVGGANNLKYRDSSTERTGLAA